MQSREELFIKIRNERPDIEDAAIIDKWIDYLLQLKGCRLASAVSQDVNPDGWLAARTDGIGGSDIAAIMNESPWNSPRQIWLKKTKQIAQEEFTQSEAARWGNVLETAVATEWGIRNDRQWIHIPVQLQSELYPWMLANIDGFTLSDDKKEVTGILEIKTTSAYNNEAWENGPIPYYYVCQASWYCTITGMPQFDIVCLVGGQKLYSYQFPLDPDLSKRMIQESDVFWNNNVRNLIEPPLNASDLEATKAVVADEDAPPVILDDDESEKLVDLYVQLREKITALSKVKEALYAQIFGKIGNATQAVTQTRIISLQQSARRSCNYDMLEANYPEAYRECINTTISKSLRIK